MFYKSLKALFAKNTVLINIRQYGSVLLQENAAISEPVQFEYPEKLLKVAVIGIPNSGKSTFINNLMDRKVCATSSKVHTTRKKLQAIFTEGDSQIVFLDTPGLVNDREQKKHHLENSFIKDSETSLQQADIIGVIHDVGSVWTRDRLDIKVIRLLENHIKKPSFLVLNKIDILKSKRKLLDVTRLLTENCIAGKPMSQFTKSRSDIKGWPHFQDVFMVSALTGSGLSEIKDYLIKNALPAKWNFPAESWSDQSKETLILNAVKGKLLDFLPDEIPYEMKPIMEFCEVNKDDEAWCNIPRTSPVMSVIFGAVHSSAEKQMRITETRENMRCFYAREVAEMWEQSVRLGPCWLELLNVVVLVKCPTLRKAKLAAGVKNGRLNQIIDSVQKELENAFQQLIRIKIVLKARDNK